MILSPQAADLRARWIGASSLETTPGTILSPKDALAGLEPGAAVFVTALRDANPAETIAASVHLARRGFVPVPHLAARGLRDAAQLRDLCRALVSEAGVSHVLLVAGGLPHPVGDFADTHDVLRTEILPGTGIRHVFVAGHPEGHPEAPAGPPHASLLHKQAVARAQGLTMEIVTQFAFEAAPIIAWERSLRAAGVHLPVRVGLHGLVSPRILVRYGLVCGIGPSLRFMQAQKRRLHRWFLPSDPAILIDPLAAHAATDPATLLSGLHFFPFGAVARTLVWRRAEGARTHDAEGARTGDHQETSGSSQRAS